MITFEDYVEDFMDMHIALMSEEQLADARKAYNQFVSDAPKRRTALSDKALEARKVAKFFGGMALVGTKRQKEWAEKIRADKLHGMTELQALQACDPTGLLKHSKFWIENRDRSGKEIGEFVELQKSLLKKYQAAYAEKDHDAVKRLADHYNELTTNWGFE